jgi:4'-phosphopantetheinyl transferase
VDRLGSKPQGIAHLLRIDIATWKQPSDKHWSVLSESERSRANRFVRVRDRNQFVLAHAALRQIVGSYHNIQPGSIQFTLGNYGKPHLDCPGRPRRVQPMAAKKPPSSTRLEVPYPSPSNDSPGPPAGLSDTWEWPPLEFSLTHSGDWALVAMATRPVGADAEQVRQVDSLDTMIDRICTSQERQYLCQMVGEEQLVQFFRLWTAKEAVLKGAGLGLQIEPSQVEIPASGDGQWIRVPFTAGDQHNEWHLQRLAVDETHTAAIAITEGAVELRMGTWMG